MVEASGPPVTVAPLDRAVLEAAAADDDVQAIQALFDLAPYGDPGNAVLHQILEHYVSECMGAAGFDYSNVPFVPRGTVIDALGLVPPLPDQAAVEAQGYSALSAPQLAPVPPEWTRATSENDARSSDDSWAEAYAGDDATGRPGCRLLAEQSVAERAELRARELYAAIAPSVIPILSITAAYESSSAFRSTTSEWQLCMTARGFNYESPVDAMMSFPSQADGTPSDGEVLTASADFQCRAQTGYQESLLNAFGELAREWMRQNEGQVLELKNATSADIAALNELAENVGAG